MSSRIPFRAIVLALVVAIPAWAGEPRDLIASNARRAVQRARESGGSGAASVDKMRTVFVEQMEPLFDYRELTMRTLGVHARKYSEAEVKALTGVFRDFLRQLFRSTLLPKNTFQNLERVDVTDELIRGRYARVATVAMVRRENKPETLPVVYLLVNTRDKKWSIYDMEIDGYSIVSNYRAQFDAVLKNKPLAELMKILGEKTRNLVKENTAGSSH